LQQQESAAILDPVTVARIPPIIDLDAHVVEPPDVWSSRLPRRLRDTGPHIEMLPQGVAKMAGTGYIEAPGTDGPLVAWWCYEDHRASIKRTIAAAGYPAEEVVLKGITYDDMRPGCWQQGARLEDMDLNGVEAQLCFPNYPRFCGQQFLWGNDRELALLCVKAYNDWMVEEWCGGSASRLIPLCLIPLWDVDLAIEEVERNAARGVRAVAFSEIPAYLDLPSLYDGAWEPFFATCQETGTVIAMHIGSGTKVPQTSSDAPVAVQGTILFGNTVASMSDFLFSGVLHRYPKLKLLYAESQIGWIPFLLERADDLWLTHRGWSESQRYCPEPPSTYYFRQISSCFFKDRVGIEMLDRVWAGNVVFETDYPHQDGTWPLSREAAASQFGDLDQHLIDRIARGNAIDLLGLPFPHHRSIIT
jgi:predicted TIM-barrel fold metal-dependent hydrolase